MGWMRRKGKNDGQSTEMVSFTEMGKMRSRLREIIESFILCLLNLRLLMRHASGALRRLHLCEL